MINIDENAAHNYDITDALDILEAIFPQGYTVAGLVGESNSEMLVKVPASKTGKATLRRSVKLAAAKI